MKIFIFLNFILSLLFIGCSKEEYPSVKIILGTKTISIYEGFLPFKSQDTIWYNQLDTIDIMRIEVIESNVDSSYFLYTERTPIFNFSIMTSKDKEYFASGHNCWLSGWGGGSNADQSDVTLQGEVQFPIKISKFTHCENDTLEFNAGNDYIIVSYSSIYSKLSVRDSTIILK